MRRGWKLRPLLKVPQPKTESELPGQADLAEDNPEDDSRYEEVAMGRTWTKKKFEIEDFDPEQDGNMPDCSSADSAQEGYADDEALNGTEGGDK
jgi:hypothetical protein